MLFLLISSWFRMNCFTKLLLGLEMISRGVEYWEMPPSFRISTRSDRAVSYTHLTLPTKA